MARSTRVPLIPRFAVLLMAAGVLSWAPAALAQECPNNCFATGTVTIGDGSTPGSVVGAEFTKACPPGACAGPIVCYVGSGGTCSAYLGCQVANEGTWNLTGASAGYISNRPGVATICTPADPGCVQCSGAGSATIYLAWGNYSGLVSRIPPSSDPLGDRVNGSAGQSQLVHPDGWFTYDPTPTNGNNDGVPVDGEDAGYGRGVATHWLAYDPNCSRVTATTHSNEDTQVSLCVIDPALEQESRSCPAPGQPVSVSTGNVFLDQTDATIPGVSANGLSFVRAYNSLKRGPNQYGLFGPGWFSTYEKRLSFAPSQWAGVDVVMLREGDAEMLYFADKTPGDSDHTYVASYPADEQSKVVKQADGTYLRQFRRGGSETYDPLGRLTALTDPPGNVTTLTRDAAGQLLTVKDTGGPGARTLTLTYTGGLLTGLSGPGGPIATYTHENAAPPAAFRLKTVTYADAQASGYTFTYDSNNQLTQITDHQGIVIETHEYYTGGFGKTSEVSLGVEKYTFVYDPNPPLPQYPKTTVTDALGNQTVYEYTTIWGAKKVTKITGGCSSCGGSGNETQEWTYDDKGRKTSHKDGLGNVTKYTYDPVTGDMLTETDALNHTTTHTYYTDGRVHTRSDPNGGLTTWVWGPAGPTSITQTLNGTESSVTTIAYTTAPPLGKPEFTTDPRGKVWTLHHSATTGDLEWIKDPMIPGNTTSFVYDDLGRRTKTIDALLNHSPTTTYNARGQVTRITNPNLSYTDFTYDRGGRRKTVRDALDCTTTYGYDAYGRLETVTDCATPETGVTRYGYDLMSNLKSLKDARNKETKFDYDGYNRVWKVTYPGTEQPPYYEEFTYYPTGRLKTKRDRKGVVTTFTYDAVGRLTGKAYSDGSPAVTFRYDESDDVGYMTYASNSADTLTWDYDLAGRRLSETSTANSSIVAYKYDLAGNRVELRLDGTLFVDHQYGDAGQLQSITRSGQSINFGYDSASRRTGMTLPNDVGTTYGYDGLSRLTSIQVVNQAYFPATTLYSAGYSYNDVNNRMSKTEPWFAETYTYDAVSRLKDVFRSSQTEGYTYDLVGNRLTSYPSSTLWSYDDRNQLLSTPTASFAYDDNGNMRTKTESGSTWTYDWDVDNRLTRVVKGAKTVATFSYDPLGRRIRKVAGTTTTAFLYDGEDILRQTSGTTTLRYIHGPGIDEPLATEDAASPGVLTYFHPDGLGSVVLGPGGPRQYDAFGNLQLGATNPGYAFTGREWDPETGLYYYRARYYDPKIGRFISEDSTRFRDAFGPVDVNLYQYAKLNPVNYIDPDGRSAMAAGGGLGIWIAICHRQANDRADAIFNQTSMSDPSFDKKKHCFAACYFSRCLAFAGGPMAATGQVLTEIAVGWDADSGADTQAAIYGIARIFHFDSCDTICRSCPIK